MKLTIDGSQKLLDNLMKDKSILLKKIDDLSVYVAAVTENEKELKPEFDLMDTIKQIEEIDKKIVKIRHCRNQFNNTSVINEIGMTASEALVMLPIIKVELNKWEALSVRQEKTRKKSGLGSNKEIEYEYTNYSIQDIKKKYEEVRDMQKKIQQELNLFNATEIFDVDI